MANLLTYLFFIADEYRKTIGKDAALERRFQPITIDEPTVSSTISILRGLKPRYEVHHGVEIADGALVTGLPCYCLRFRRIADIFLTIQLRYIQLATSQIGSYLTKPLTSLTKQLQLFALPKNLNQMHWKPSNEK